MHTRPRSLALLALVAAALVVAACGGGTTASPTPSPVTVDSPEAAARLVAAKSPLFEGIEARDPDLIGQAHWWEAVAIDDGWRVTFRVGWGDCPAGCIDEHTWTYDVTADGTLGFVEERGTAVPQQILDELRAAAQVTGVAGRVVAGPTCPVENPADPTCNPRPVAGAVLVVTGAGGAEVARVTTDATGLFRIGLQPGDYTLEPQPVEGLVGTASPVTFTVTDGNETLLDVGYDTGIR
ncbi:MAG: hypothetical protein A2V85_14745 [Chloroflexi bacterium RBG_16_72_14]|nr:MAG: hypothetical protein A2V85_14745 [Chloroflexi bacterium RBG_16_72_14]